MPEAMKRNVYMMFSDESRLMFMGIGCRLFISKIIDDRPRRLTPRSTMPSSEDSDGKSTSKN